MREIQPYANKSREQPLRSWTTSPKASGETAIRNSGAKASVYEVRSQVYKASDRGYLEEESYQKLLALTKQTEQLIGGFIRYLQNSPLKGHKLKPQSPTKNKERRTKNGKAGVTK